VTVARTIPVKSEKNIRIVIVRRYCRDSLAAIAVDAHRVKAVRSAYAVAVAAAAPAYRSLLQR